MNGTRHALRAPLARWAIAVCIALACAPGSASGRKHAAQSAMPKHVRVQSNQVAATPDPGERKFQANCSRCHTSPAQLSPRITGTIVMHMRVRASLSDKDAQDILRYLSP